jgi:LacI family gluconate utilization system Gnt-I transcriptional repressor
MTALSILTRNGAGCCRIEAVGAIIEQRGKTRLSRGGAKIPKKRITLDDVARVAKVSPITVSRALRRPDMVSDELRQRIDGAVMKLGYVPSFAASRLASARSHAIGVIVPTLYNVIFAEYLQALHEVFLPLGFQLVVVNSRYSREEEESAVRTLLGQHVEAMIIVGVGHSPLTRRLLKQSRIPVIETFQIAREPIGVNIGLDHVAAGADATRSLLAAGYRRVGFMLGQRDERAAERLAGYEQAMEEAGLRDLCQVTAIPGASNIALGAQLMASLKEQDNIPEALFCIDDNLALGALLECRRMGLSVPDDIAVLGFHDLEFAACASPPLSSVATFRYDMGKLAAETAVRMLNTGRAPDSKVIDLGYRVVKRQSTP